MSIATNFHVYLIVISAILVALDGKNCDSKNIMCLGEDPSDTECSPIVENSQSGTDMCRTFVAGYLSETNGSISWTVTVNRDTLLTVFKIWFSKQVNDSSVMMVVDVKNEKNIDAYSTVKDPNSSEPEEEKKVGNTSVGSFHWQHTYLDGQHIHVNFKSNRSIVTYLPIETVANLVEDGSLKNITKTGQNMNASFVQTTIDLTKVDVYAHIEVIEYNSTSKISQVKTSKSIDVIDLFDKISDEDRLTEEEVNDLIKGHGKKVNVRYIVGLTVGGLCLVIGTILMLYLTGGEPPQTIITSEDSQVIIGVDNDNEHDEHEEHEEDKEGEKDDD